MLTPDIKEKVLYNYVTNSTLKKDSVRMVPKGGCGGCRKRTALRRKRLQIANLRRSKIKKLYL
jgi:hypothetical protein